MGQQGFVSRVSVCRCGEIGRHEGLKIPFWRQSTGSTPVGGMKKSTLIRKKINVLFDLITHLVTRF